MPRTSITTSCALAASAIAFWFFTGMPVRASASNPTASASPSLTTDLATASAASCSSFLTPIPSAPLSADFSLAEPRRDLGQ